MSQPQDCKSIFFEADSANWRASDKRIGSHDVEFIRADLCVTNFVTVRQAFERAYGPLPEGATCHIGFLDNFGEPHWGSAVIEFPTPNNPNRDRDICEWDSADECWISIFEFCNDPIPTSHDLSQNPAYCYENFMCSRYDNAVRELEAGE